MAAITNKYRRTGPLGAFGLLLSLFLLSCASIPKEAPLLSEELGQEIAELESSHLGLVESFFELKRKNIRNYLDEVWLPEYARAFFSNPDIRNVWEQVASTGSEEDRLMFILTTAPELQADINEQYQRSVAELNLLEKELKNVLREKYLNTRSINNTITSFLVSASEVDENRQRYLNMAGFTENKIGAVIDEAEALTLNLVNRAVDADNKLATAEEHLQEYGEKIRSLIQKLK